MSVSPCTSFEKICTRIGQLSTSYSKWKIKLKSKRIYNLTTETLDFHYGFLTPTASIPSNRFWVNDV